MGKRKSRKAAQAPTRKVPKLDTTFNCPFCNNERSVSAKLDMDVKIGTLKCQICEAHFEAKIHALSEPVDIYADWIDECEALNTGEL